MLTVPFGVVEVCHAGVSRTLTQPRSTVPPMLGSLTSSTPDSLELVGQLDDRHDRRARALGDVHGVADVVGVSVGEEDRVGGDLVGARSRLRVAGEERIDEHGLAVVLQRERGVAQELDLHLRRLLCIVVDIEQLACQLEPHRDAHEHAQARLLGDQDAERRLALRAVGRGGHAGDLRPRGPRRTSRPPRAPR